MKLIKPNNFRINKNLMNTLYNFSFVNLSILCKCLGLDNLFTYNSRFILHSSLSSADQSKMLICIFKVGDKKVGACVTTFSKATKAQRNEHNRSIALTTNAKFSFPYTPPTKLNAQRGCASS